MLVCRRQQFQNRLGLKTESFSFILEELILPKLSIVEESSQQISEAYAVSKGLMKGICSSLLALKLRAPIWINRW